MPCISRLAPLLWPLAAPRPLCRQNVRFFTATISRTDKVSPLETPSQAPPAPPSTASDASRAADLAAAEAITESDSAQPPEPKPTLPSQRPRAPKVSAVFPSSHFPAPSVSDLAPPRYHVSRSATKNLPIYTDYKRGGNKHITIVRKISGDAGALRDELRAHLKRSDEEVSVNSLTGHVVVKGHCKPTIQVFLEARGM